MLKFSEFPCSIWDSDSSGNAQTSPHSIKQDIHPKCSQYPNYKNRRKLQLFYRDVDIGTIRQTLNKVQDQISEPHKHWSQIHQIQPVRVVHKHSDEHTFRKILIVQYAFKTFMIHELLQFALHIAFRCVFQSCENLDIRCWKLFYPIERQN